MPQSNLSFFHKNSNATKFMRINKIVLKRNIKQMKLYGSVNHSFIKFNSSRPVEHYTFLVIHFGDPGLPVQWTIGDQWNSRTSEVERTSLLTDSTRAWAWSLDFRCLRKRWVTKHTLLVDLSVFILESIIGNIKTGTSEQPFCIPNKDDLAYLCYRIGNTSSPVLRPKPF